jgi:hypothetical protein
LSTQLSLVSAHNVEPFEHPGHHAQGDVVQTLDDEIHAEGSCFDSYPIVAHARRALSEAPEEEFRLAHLAETERGLARRPARNPGCAGRRGGLRIIQTGFASLDVPTPQQIKPMDDDDFGDRPAMVGRRSFAKFNKALEVRI